MKRLVFTGPRQYHYDQVPDLAVERPHDVLIDVRYAGICGTDVHIFHGRRGVRYPLVGGHEVVGVVRAVGPEVARVKPGDLVTCEANATCGICRYCISGRKNLCEEKATLGITVDGVFQTQARVPEACVWPLPGGVAPLAAVAVESAAVALGALRKSDLSLGSHVLIAGAGTVGLMALQLAKLSGARVSVLNRSESRLLLAKKLGADQLCGQGDPLPQNVDIALDCAGSPQTMAACIAALRRTGTFVNVGIPSEIVPMDMVKITKQEITVKGSVACTTEFPAILRLIAQGKLDTAAVTTHTVGFDKLVEGIELMESRQAVKVAVKM